MKVDQALMEHLNLVLKGQGFQGNGEGGGEFAEFLSKALADNFNAGSGLEDLINSIATADDGALNSILGHLVDTEMLLESNPDIVGEMLEGEGNSVLYQLLQIVDNHHKPGGELLLDDFKSSRGSDLEAIFTAKAKAGEVKAPVDFNLSAAGSTAREDITQALKNLPDSELAKISQQLKTDSTGKPVAVEEMSLKNTGGKGAADPELILKENAGEKMPQPKVKPETAIAADKQEAVQKNAVVDKAANLEANKSQENYSSVRQVEADTAPKQRVNNPAPEQANLFQQPAVQGDDQVQASRILQTPAQTNNLRENILQQLEGRMVYLRETTANPAEMRMTLHPPELGEVTIRVFSKQGRLSASIIAETALVREILESSITELRQRMNFVTIEFDQFDFSSKEEQYDDSGKPGEGKNNPLLNQAASGKDGSLSEEGDPALQNAPPRSDVNGIDYWA